MIETSTTFLINKVNSDVQYVDVTEGFDTDDLIFYNSLCVDLDAIQKDPKAETIGSILKYSQAMR
ncbi:MAG: hypothetical protein ACOH2A_06200 [Sphingobacteriaceae bacterium]